MNEIELNKHVAELNRGAQMIDAQTENNKKLPGSSVVSRVGRILVETGGVELLHKAHQRVDARYQRTVELQWYGVTYGDRQWLP